MQHQGGGGVMPIREIIATASYIGSIIAEIPYHFEKSTIKLQMKRESAYSE